jgi:hypothetical protein
MTWKIYSLTDPRDGRVRYVGKTNDIRIRLSNHVSQALHYRKRNHRVNWIRSLVEGGQLPVLSILEEGAGDWAAAEKKWIARFRQAGYELVNATDGGEGNEGGHHSVETRAKIGAAGKGRPCTAETREKMRAAAKARSAEISAANKRRVVSEETRAKMSAAAKARATETSLRLKGHILSAESRAKISAANTGRRLSAEAIAKRSAAQVGRRHSTETRSKMSVITKAYWAARKARSQQ